MTFPFKRNHRERGKLLIASKGVKSVLFSEGTYQVEVFDSDLRKTFFPFLQIDDRGELKDSFCTCEIGTEKRSCPHLAAAFLLINRQQEPLHSRFRHSFWNHLCFMAFKQCGADTSSIKKKEETSSTYLSSNAENPFSIRVKTPKGKKLLDEYIFKRASETEENSLKFSNLSSEELSLWKKGTPTQKLQYELSFWSDLAKWMFLKQLFLEKYEIDFLESGKELPKKVRSLFAELEIEFSIAQDSWEVLIPSLKEVNSPLQVHEFREIRIEKISYDPAAKEISIEMLPLIEEQEIRSEGVKLRSWEFQSGRGFFPLETPPLLKQRVVRKDQIGELLSNHYEIVKKYLVNAPISREKITLSYLLDFDQKKRLHISCFAFQAGDLQEEEATFFKPWVYLKDRGFFPLDTPLFDNFETVIPFEKMGSFISEYRLWLSRHEGFQIHLSGIEFNLVYRFEKQKILRFENEAHPFEGSDGVIDFGNWLYIKGKGFYKKRQARGFSKINTETKVHLDQISEFIHANRDDLEQIKSFFNPNQPIEEGGLNIFIDSKERICVEPEFVFSADYVGKRVHLLNDFTYVEGEGFSEIPQGARLPKEYRQPLIIEKGMESQFVSTELPKLKPLILEIDSRLTLPKNLKLRIKRLAKDRNQEEKKWVAHLFYESEFGEKPVGVIKDFLDENQGYAATQIGLIFFNDPRFIWLSELPKERFSRSQESVTLTTLEWIRLNAYEEIEKPGGDGEQDKQTRELIDQIDCFGSEELLQLDALKSRLRPYQEVGVKWLWSLYSYGLSGLLCDDMGLGKTHQAMGLIAAAYRLKERALFFVVCPTSVLYHWEELLSSFLPSLKVVVFYGTQRTIADFHENGSLLLTSYGTLRSEKEMIAEISFDVAIFDETQMAKNRQSQTHKALSMIKATTKIGLTGTPIENQLTELKALFDIILPGYLPPQKYFRDHFVTPIEKYRDKKQAALLSKQIHPFVLRRKKSEVLHDLPEKIEEIARCELSDEQRTLYKQAYNRSRDQLVKSIEKQNGPLPYLHIFALLNTLKQICNHPSLVLDDIPHYKEHQSGKWSLFVELLSETRASGQKLVLFTQYLGMMAIAQRYLKENGIGYASIRGSTRDRKKELEKFRTDPMCEVFVASLRAAGTGIDLTAASVVIHYDRWWNPAVERQATDRVHRIGQNRGVQVFKMVTIHTVEEHIDRLIQKKVRLLETVLDYDDQSLIKKLGRSELLDLIGQMNRDVSTYL